MHGITFIGHKRKSVKKRLTDTDIAKLPTPQPGQPRLWAWGAVVPGLGVEVTRNGHRAFKFQYRHAGASRRITIRALGIEAARQQAADLFA
jgi:hypothetical protein